MVWLYGPVYFVIYLLFVTCLDLELLEPNKCLCVCSYIILGFCPLVWTVMVCLYSMMVHTSSHRNPKDTSGAVFVAGKKCI